MGRRRGVGRLVAASGWTWLAGLQPGTGVLPLMRACLPSVVGRAMRHRYSLAACVLKQLTHAECQEHKASVLEARPLPHAPLHQRRIPALSLGQVMCTASPGGGGWQIAVLYDELVRHDLLCCFRCIHVPLMLHASQAAVGGLGWKNFQFQARGRSCERTLPPAGQGGLSSTGRRWRWWR